MNGAPTDRSHHNSEATPLNEVARRPQPHDNCAIAIVDLPAGFKIQLDSEIVELPYAVLEGHRFPVIPISTGAHLNSWGLPFGKATRPIASGEAIYNEMTLEVLRLRRPNLQIPDSPNFENYTAPFALDESTYQPAPDPELYTTPKTFLGYDRGPERGSGTRNYIAIIGLSSRSAPFVEELADRLRQRLTPEALGFDGIVPVTHTEGGAETEPNNIDLVLRTLSGWITHPNLGATLCVDAGFEAINGARVQEFMRQTNAPTDGLPLEFLSLQTNPEDSFSEATTIVENWVPEVAGEKRTPCPLRDLKIALQCGGSDAFSGLSGNPLAGWIAKELIHHGGSANLGETSELIGAESYVLDKTRNADVARRFIETRDRFQRMAEWHGHSAEGNPSGGNVVRGLYNIAIKSIGAANKKHPDVRLDEVIDYAEPMREPGYYFMDSPGNDLESIAGQVASGCNLILFITGNGSITNFPFVPTLKIVTTTQRFQLLNAEMDINAGRFQDGESMDALGMEGFELTLETANGRKTAGELAGHSQAQIWRDWAQASEANIPSFKNRSQPNAVPIDYPTQEPTETERELLNALLEIQNRYRLIAPVSLCSGQIARLAAESLNRELLDSENPSPFVALNHTEGCGVSRGPSEDLYVRTLTSYALSPLVESCLFLEHGCEKTHNDEFRKSLAERGRAPEDFGWASVQLDGGALSVHQKIRDWFTNHTPTPPQTAPPRIISFISETTLEAPAGAQFREFAQRCLHEGISLVIGAEDPSLAALDLEDVPLSNHKPTLEHGANPTIPGLHIMEMPTQRFEERLTGLAASGSRLTLLGPSKPSTWANPIVPLIPFTTGDSLKETLHELVLTLQNQQAPHQSRRLKSFQITRAQQGFSL